jgi:hypothetical protein
MEGRMGVGAHNSYKFIKEERNGFLAGWGNCRSFTKN